jgi:hypothetical protein
MMIAHKCDGSKEPHASTEESGGRVTNRSKIVRLNGRSRRTCERRIMHALEIARLGVRAEPIIVNLARIDVHDG